MSRFYLTLKPKGMKTLFFGFAFLVCLSVTAQEQKTIFRHPSVVSTAFGKTAQLSWVKGDEDVAYFVVERSTDGVDFKQCAIVWLSEDPAYTEYRFRDKLAENISGLLYRIGIVDANKRITYLPVRKVISPETL